MGAVIRAGTWGPAGTTFAGMLAVGLDVLFMTGFLVAWKLFM